MKPNHRSLSYKMQAKPNKTYKDLKQKQKKKIADWMFQSVCEYYKEHGKVYRTFLKKLPCCELCIIENGLPEEPPPKKKGPAVPKKKGNSNKVCPNCGKKMKQQFIGLQHCKCGVS